MKKKTTLSALSLLLPLAFAACDTGEKDESWPAYVAPKTNTDQLVGEWEWIRTSNGWGGTETPASKGYTETLFLGEANQFKRTRNRVVAEEKYYYINKVSSALLPQDSVLYIFLVDKNNAELTSSQPLYRLSADTLMTRFSERCDDCPEAYFVRKKAPFNK